VLALAHAEAATSSEAVNTLIFFSCVARNLTTIVERVLKNQSCFLTLTALGYGVRQPGERQQRATQLKKGTAASLSFPNGIPPESGQRNGMK
jgi:hypothetical protein